MQPELVAIARRRGGVFTRAEALQVGYSPAEIRARLASGRWQRLRRGLYAAVVDSGERTSPQSFAAVLATHPGAVLSHRSAALLHDLPALGRDDQFVHVIVPGGRARRRRGVAVHAAELDPGDVVELDRLSLTSLARTAVDMAALLPLPFAVAVADAALRARPGIEPRMREIGEQVRGRTVRRVLDLSDGRAESPGESLSRVAMASHGLPMPRLQEWVGDAGEPIGRVDFLWPNHSTVGEFDGRTKYATRDDVWAEKLREDRLRAAGFEVVRWVWADVVGDFGPVAARLRAAFARATHRR
jgi:hypothetical protein